MNYIPGGEIGGLESRPRRLLPVIALTVILTFILASTILWFFRPRTPHVGVRPPGVPFVEDHGVTFACPEFRLHERQLIATLDLPSRHFNGSWFALERDPEVRLWVTYGGTEYTAIVLQVTPIRMPDGSPIDRIAIMGFLDRNQPPPSAEKPMKAGLQLPGRYLRRDGLVRLTVDGIERVTK